jgi:hypothetical protein
MAAQYCQPNIAQHLVIEDTALGASDEHRCTFICNIAAAIL